MFVAHIRMPINASSAGASLRDSKGTISRLLVIVHIELSSKGNACSCIASSALARPIRRRRLERYAIRLRCFASPFRAQTSSPYQGSSYKFYPCRNPFYKWLSYSDKWPSARNSFSATVAKETSARLNRSCQAYEFRDLYCCGILPRPKLEHGHRAKWHGEEHIGLCDMSWAGVGTPGEVHNTLRPHGIADMK